jgi:hypothetical protein
MQAGVAWHRNRYHTGRAGDARCTGLWGDVMVKSTSRKITVIERIEIVEHFANESSVFAELMMPQ